jgi:hypothetical protein
MEGVKVKQNSDSQDRKIKTVSGLTRNNNEEMTEKKRMYKNVL